MAPHRRSRIIDAAQALIAEQGIAGTTHRKVAAWADVPLGSMTYHFESMDDLLKEALAAFASAFGQRFEKDLAKARPSKKHTKP